MPRFSPRAPSSPPSPNSLLLHSLPPLSGSQYSPSLPASPLATLPPPLLRGCFPNRTVPLPPVTTGRCRLHSLLQASPSPQIQWDVRKSPFRAIRTQSSPHVHEQNVSWVHEPATTPPLQSITVRVEGCENALVVFAGASNTNYITILDLLTRIHRAPRFALRIVEPRPAQGTNHRERDVLDATPYNGSLLFAVGPSVTLTSQIDHQTATEMRTGRRVAGPRVQGVDGNGWRWIGLQGSTTERDVWNVNLGSYEIL